MTEKEGTNRLVTSDIPNAFRRIYCKSMGLMIFGGANVANTTEHSIHPGGWRKMVEKEGTNHLGTSNIPTAFRHIYCKTTDWIPFHALCSLQNNA